MQTQLCDDMTLKTLYTIDVPGFVVWDWQPEWDRSTFVSHSADPTMMNGQSNFKRQNNCMCCVFLFTPRQLLCLWKKCETCYDCFKEFSSPPKVPQNLLKANVTEFPIKTEKMSWHPASESIAMSFGHCGLTFISYFYCLHKKIFSFSVNEKCSLKLNSVQIPSPFAN